MAEQNWNASAYDAAHGYVWKHGASLVELLAPKAGERILDLGCGTGHLTAQIAGAGAGVGGELFEAVFASGVLHGVPPPRAGQVVDRVAAALKPGGRFVAEFGGKG